MTEGTMIKLILGSLGTFMSFFGIFTNLYVLVVLLLNKKTRSSSEWILLHLSSCGLGVSLCNLVFLSPSMFMGRWVMMSMISGGCNFVGSSLLILQLLTVWSICALSADRCAAIASPLRYTSLVTRRRIAGFYSTLWCLSVATVLGSFFVSTVVNLEQSPVQSLGGSEGSVSRFNESFESMRLTTTGRYANEEVKVGAASAAEPNSNPFISTSTYSGNFPTTTNMIIDLGRSSGDHQSKSTNNNNNNNNNEQGSSVNDNNLVMNTTYIITTDDQASSSDDDLTSAVRNQSLLLNTRDGSNKNNVHNNPFQYREMMGVCLPKMYGLSVSSIFWMSCWVLLILVAPMITLLICDLTVLSIARKQRHRIVMALYQITTVTQVTVTGSKGTALPSLWLNRSIPARSRACRAVWEDLATLLFLHLPLILILIVESIVRSHEAPPILEILGSLSLYATPSLTAVLYGIRARPLRAAYKSYLRKRLTNSTLQHEIQQRLSPVDGSPRPSSRAKSFRSSTPSPNSSPICTPSRRLSSNDLRPPPHPLNLTIHTSPSHDHLGRNHPNGNGNQFVVGSGFCKNGNGKTTRKVRSFLHIPSQVDMQEFWSGLRRPNRSPTIVITHEIRIKESTSSVFSPPSPTTNSSLNFNHTTAEQRL